MSPKTHANSEEKKENQEKRKPETKALVSPAWGNTTKLVISLSAIGVVAFLLVRFSDILGPLVLAVLLSYLLHPMAGWLQRWSRMSWRVASTLVFILTVIVILGMFTLGGLAIVDQAGSLIRFLETAVKNLPGWLDQVSSQPIIIGPFTYRIDPSLLNLDTLGQGVLSAVQPLLSQAGNLVGTIASGAATFFGWLFFVLIVAYFVMTESGGADRGLFVVRIPGYDQDLIRLGDYLGRIWNAFLRGQLTIIMITIVVYGVMLGGLGVRYFIGLALLAGLARFVPYVGPAVAWTTYGLVTLFQPANNFGLTPLWYTVLVIGSAMVMDFMLDNFVGTRVMGTALKIHPAAVMITALIAANLIGVIGVVLAAPVVATFKLLAQYVTSKLQDLNPWEVIQPAAQFEMSPLAKRIDKGWDAMRYWFRQRIRRPAR